MTFQQKLDAAWKKSRSLVCVGLDPEKKRLPERMFNRPDAIFAFNKAIIDATHDIVCAYKPQFAHYAAVAAEDQHQFTTQRSILVGIDHVDLDTHRPQIVGSQV